MNVVLPAPLGPMTACVSPSLTSKSMPSVARSAPKVLVRPRTSSIALLEQAREPTLEEQHRQHEQRPEDHLPVLGPVREQVLEHEQDERAEHRAGARAHAAEDHHEHDLA